jgi:FkbH-like protein
MNQSEIFKLARDLRKQDRGREALLLLREGLRRGQLDPEGINQAGRFVQKELLNGKGEPRLWRVLLLGQCTTSWLATALTAVAWSRGVALVVSEGGYDTVLQDLTLQLANSERPDAVVLLPWLRRVAGNGEDMTAPPATQKIVDDELAYWRHAWDLLTQSKHTRLVQLGYDWVTPGPLGHHLGGKEEGPVHLVREINSRLRDALPSGSFFIDLDQISGSMGRASFYDMRRYFWTKQPFSEAGGCSLAEHLWAGIRAITTGPKKVVIVDLDNTLWGGVVGETGPLDVALGDSPDGEAFRDFQSHLKELTRRGILLAVASKNNPDDAREPFLRNPDMVLKLDDFAAFEASWEPKDVMIRRIAQTLNLGLDSFVFFDDNPAEREQIRQALPEVEVVGVPAEPAEYVRALQTGLWFETTHLTQEDRERKIQYVQENQRREFQRSFASLDDYLSSLEMHADVQPIDAPHLPRVVQLLAKTNQFNLTTRRHSREDVVRLLDTPGAVGLMLRMRDRFGDHGLVSLLLAVPLPQDYPKTLRIDSWLMSCRVIGRTVEQFLFGILLEQSRQMGYQRILGEFIPTSKNALVNGLYPALGFTPVPQERNGSAIFELNLDAAVRPKTFIKGKDEQA